MPDMRPAPRPLSLPTRRARRLRVEQAMEANPKKIGPLTYIKRRRKALLVTGSLALLKGALGAGAGVAVKAATKAAGVAMNKDMMYALRGPSTVHWTGDVGDLPVEAMSENLTYLQRRAEAMKLKWVRDDSVWEGHYRDAEGGTYHLDLVAHNPARFKRTRIASPEEFDPRSFRTITPGSGRHKAVVGCPKGEYRGGRCKVGMEVQSVLRAKENEWAKNPRLKRFRLLDAIGGVVAGVAAESEKEALRGIKAHLKKEKWGWPRGGRLVQVKTAPLFKRGGPSAPRGKPIPTSARGKTMTPALVSFAERIEKKFGVAPSAHVKWFAAGKRNPGVDYHAKYRTLSDQDLGAYAFTARSTEEARARALAEGKKRGAWGCWLTKRDKVRGEHLVVSNPGRVYGPGKVEYRTVNTRTEKGLKEAERLKEQGWQIGSVGFETIQFFRLKPSARKNFLMPGAPDVLSVTVKHGSQPQQALIESGWKVSQVKGDEAVMVKTNPTRDDEVGLIMAYEAGELDDEAVLGLFSGLIKSGLVRKLQGHYGRTAKQLIDAGYVSAKGDILVQPNAPKGWHKLMETESFAKAKASRDRRDKDMHIGAALAHGVSALENPLVRRGSQTLEPLKESGYELVARKRGQAILRDKEDGHLELWFANKYAASYTIQIGNTAYEYARRLKPDEAAAVLQNPLLMVVPNPGIDPVAGAHMARGGPEVGKAPQRWVVRRDGEILHVAPTNVDAADWIHQHTSYSVDWAVKHEGYTVTRENPVENPGDDMGSIVKHPDFNKGVSLYKKIHHCEPESVSRVMLPIGGKKKMGRVVMVALGKAPAESYEITSKDSVKTKGQIYVHPYEHKPIKAVDVTGKVITTLPGSHAVKQGKGQDQAWING